MNSYKLFTFLAILVFPFLNGHAFECKDLKENLIVLEHDYQKATLPECTDESKTLYCKSNSDSGKSIYQAQLDYNKALAKVNMIEGLIAVSASVENSHHAMKMLEVTDLANAKSSINDFLMNYERANVLNKSMIPNSDGDFFWEDYQGTSYEFSYIFIKNKCDSGKFVDFCKMIKERADDPHYDETELYQMLHGFAQADAKGKVDYQKQHRKENYEQYRKYLRFTSSETSTPQDLSTLEEGVAGQPSEIEKVHKLQDAIKDYEKNKDDAIAQKIVKYSNDLREIDMQFSTVGVKIAEDDLGGNKVISSFEKGLTSVSAAAGILTGENNIKNNFKTVKNSLDIELEGKERSLRHKHSAVLSKLEGDCDISTSSEIKECLKSVCGSSYPRTCGNKNSQYQGIDGLLIDHNSYDQADQIRNANEMMLDCFDPENTFEGDLYKEKKVPEKKQICLDENKKKISHLFDSDKLQDAKDELVKAKKTLDFINHGANVKDILAKKFITIKMLKSNHCLNSNSKTEAGYLNSYCDIQQMNIHTKTALKLSSDIEDVLLKYNPEQYQDFINGKGKYGENKDGETYFDRMVKDCEDNNDASAVCSYFKSEDNKRKDKERKEKEKQAQKDMIYKGAYDEYKEYDAAGDGHYDDGPSGFSYAMGGLATGVVKNMPGVFNYFHTRQMFKRQTQIWDNQINYHNYYWGSGATHNRYNVTVNYDDWYANQNTFNPAGYKYFSPSNSLFFPNVAPSSFASPNMPLYTPATSSGSGFNFRQ